MVDGEGDHAPTTPTTPPSYHPTTRPSTTHTTPALHHTELPPPDGAPVESDFCHTSSLMTPQPNDFVRVPNGGQDGDPP
jgi:hypothetical protein